MRLKTLRKTVSLIASFSLLFNTFLAPAAVFAQEVTPTPTPVESSSPSPDPTVTPTDEPTPTETPAQTPELTLTPTPTATTETVVEEGHLDAVVLENTEASSIEATDLTVESDGSATLVTDKPDYAPTDTALITGAGFAPDKTYSIQIVSTDDPAVDFQDQVTADGNGEIVYSYQLDGNYRPNYTVYIKDGETVVASVTFTDAAPPPSSVNIEQCANGPLASPFNICKKLSGSDGYVTGNVNASKAHWKEGEFLPYRALIEAPNAGAQQVQFSFDTAKSSELKHAIDYLSSFDLTETTGSATSTNANQHDPCGDFISGCDPTVPDATDLIPVPTTLTSAYPASCANGTFSGSPTSGSISAWVSTGTISNLAVSVGNPATTGDCASVMTVNFDLSDGSSKVLLAWSGHVSANEDTGSGGYWGAGNAIPTGSPYHFHAGFPQISDGESFNVGNQDLQLASSAIIIPQKGHIVVDKVTDPSADSQSFTFTTSGTGYSGFSLTDTATPNDQELDAGNYSVAETVPAGWDLTGSSCTSSIQDTETPASIELDPEETVTCTFNNQKDANIIVEKQTSPDGSQQTFEFDTNYGSNFFLSDGQTNNSGDLTPGTYSVDELTPTGWDETSATCTDQSSPGSINLSAGETVTCTFTNTQRGTVVIVKDVIGNPDPTDFTFNNNFGNGNPATFMLDEDSDGTLPSSRTFEVLPGTYAVTENAVTGWQSPESTSCDSGETIESIDVGSGETVTCTFVNEELINITLVKNTNGGDDTFNFDMTGSGLPASTSLTTVSGTDTETFSGLDQDNEYSITEVVPAGWDLVSATCTGGETPASITPEPGEDVTCTFTDGKRPTLKLEKTVVNDNGGNAVETDFQGKVDGSNVAWDVVNTFDIGPHTASETTLSGYTASSWGGDCAADGSVTLSYGDNKICTVTNDDNFPSLTLVKVVTNDDGGSAAPSAWTLTATGPTGFSGAGPSVSNGVSFDAGAYDLSEAGPNGYSPSSWVCVGGTQNDNDTVTLGLGESATCTITNDDQAPTLKLVKVVTNNNGGNAVADDWTLSAAASVPNHGRNFSNAGGSGVFETIFANAGYDLSESSVTGYTAGSWSCDGGSLVGSTVTLGLNEDVTCTVTNDDDAPTLTLIKLVINDDGGSAVVGDFPLFVNGNPVTSGVANILSANTLYTATETNQSGYTPSSWSGDCNPDGTITLNEGDDKTCTITNDDQQAFITVNKVVTNNNGGSALPNDFNLTLEGSPVLSGVTVPVNPGTYTAGETLLSGYSFEGFTGDCDQNGDVTVALGETKSCTLTNNDQQAYITVVKVVTNDNGGSAAPNDFALTLEGSAVLSGVAVPVNPGTYTAGETLLSGYTFEGFSGDCNVSGDTTVALGESKTCTLTNNDQQAYITVVKVVNNNFGGTAQPDDFSLTLEGSSVLSGVATPVNPGTYTAEENLVTGYTFDGFTGDCDTSGDTTVALGESKTCTLTNSDIQPKLTLIKNVVNDNGGTLGVSDFPLFVDATPVTSSVSNGFDAGSYTASETTQFGYAASNWGGDCAADGSVTLAVGDNKTCTITNDDVSPRLIVIKHVINDNGGTAVAGDFTLDSGGTNDTPDDFAGQEAPGTGVLLDAGSYNVTESGPSGYSASFSADCAGAISVGETKTCTVTNDDISPRLIVIKHVINDNGGTAVAADFTLDAGGTNDTPDDFAGEEAPGTVVLLDAGTYIVSELGPSGYSASFSTDCSGSISVGETKTCTVTNDDVQPRLTLIKHVTNDNGGTLGVADFPLFVDVTGVVSGVSNGFNAGNYIASETQQTGYSASDWSGDCASDGSVTLAVGDNKTCEITNDDISPRLIVIKHVINDDGDIAQASDFTMEVSGTNVSDPSFPGDEAGTTVTLNAGAYSVDEADDAGYVKTLSADCSGTIALAETKTCTVTNNDTPHATRTQGFWQTHTVYTTSIFNGNSWQIGTHVIDTLPELFGGFYASISKTSSGAKRSQLDQARMQLLQQWLAAKLNCEAFGCSGTTQTLLNNAATAFAGTNRSLILSYASQLDTYNNSNDALPISGQGNATPKDSKGIANGSGISFWDSLP